MTIKAEIATVAFGPLTIQGLMNENGEFGVAVPQVAEHLQFDGNQASRTVKALLGKGFQFDKWKTPLNPKAVNVITLEAFQDLIRAMDKRGNPAAAAFVDALFGLSLQQIFADAFGQKFEAENRQRYLTTRLSTKHDFRPLTDQLKAHGFESPQDYARFVWAFQTKLGIESGTRDHVDVVTLVRLQGAQVKLTTLMECGVSPWEALKRI